jgi:multiple sugar transport system substrate-binding protein
MRPALGVILAALVVTAAGYGGGGSSTSSTSTGAFAPESASQRSGQVLKISGFGPGDDVANNRTAYAKKLLAPATIQNPGGAFDPQRFLTQFAAGFIPDVLYVDRQQVATLAAQGALTPLNGCAKAQHIDLSQYNQAALREASYQGKLYALPEFTNQRTLIVNLDALKTAGVPLSQVSTTNWDALKRTATKLTAFSGGKLTRIGFDPKIPEFFIMWAHANGADLLSADGKHANFDDPKVVQALTFTKSLIDAEGGWTKFKPFRDTWDFFGAKNQIVKNQVGAWPMESWYWNVLAGSSPTVHVAAVPFTDRTGKPFTYISGNGWAIPKGAKHLALACSWMKAMTSVQAWMLAAKKRAAASAKKGTPFTGLYTANTVADQKILNQVYTPQSPQWDKAVKLLTNVAQNAVYWPASPAGAQVQQALNDAIERVLTGQQSPQTALAEAQKRAQSAIAAASS